MVDLLMLEEVKHALKKFKKRKAAGKDNINIELIKYSGIIFQLRFLHFLNM